MKTVVLVITCKKFEQCWDPFFILFKRFWPECPYEVIMGTDIGDYSNIRTIKVGKDLGWVQNCIYILEQIDAERIIIFFEDFLPCALFDSKRIEELVKHSFDYNIGCLRLQPCPGPTAVWNHNKDLGLLGLNDPYRFSWQTAIWDRKFLINLLVPTETPWQTEIEGTKRVSKSTRHFVSVKRGESPVPYIITAIVKGRWQKDATDLLRKENISLDKITPIIQ